MIESYTLQEMSELEGKAKQTIKNNSRYIAIKVKSKRLETRAKNGEQANGYTIRYIRIEDIKRILKGKIDFTYITK